MGEYAMNPFSDVMKMTLTTELTPEQAERFRAYMTDAGRIPPVASEEARSVGEFLNVLNKPEFDARTYCRGESKSFSTANMPESLRPPLLSKDGVAVDVEGVCEEFYSAVFAKLDDNEQKNFLAFARHSGIPTNLLDITDNPLVALYFACADNNGDGYVYLYGDAVNLDLTGILRDADIVDVRTLLHRMRANGTDRDTLFNRVSAFCHTSKWFAEDACLQMLMLIAQIFGNEVADIEAAKLNEAYIKRVSAEHGAEATDMHQKWFDGEAFQSGKVYKLYREGKEELIVGLLSFIRNDIANAYVSLLARAYSLCVGYVGELNSAAGYGDEDVIVFPWLPNLLYKPLLSFYRAERQQGAFFVNLYHRGHHSTVLLRQHGISAIKIPSENKDVILRQLDRLSVNEKTIYGDIDHTAAYIRRKHRNSVLDGFEQFDNTVVSAAEIEKFMEQNKGKNIPIIMR
jgi:hypothetical protein